ncbi:MAG: amidohydrolase family protein, partial [Gemmatimonadota bacterium]
NARIVDARAATPRAPVDIAIRSGRIEAIRPVSADAWAGSASIDVGGHFVVPGFVDLHVHLPPDSAVQEAILDRLVEHGVTTILNPGARVGSGIELRDRIAGAPPRMLTAGPIIERRDLSEASMDWAVLVETEAEARAEVRRQIASGVDFVKIYSGVSPDLAGVVVDEAALSGVPVIAHAGATSWTQAARAGVSMLVHSGYGTPMDEIVNLPNPASATDAEWYAGYADAPNGAAFRDLVELLKDRQVTVVPTLAITQAAGLGKDASLLPRFETHLAPETELPGWWPHGWETRHPQYGDDVGPEEAALLERVYWPGVLGIVRAFHEQGVRLGVGTDVGNAWITPGASFHYEMSLYADAGISPHSILSMATMGGAAALGLADSIGTVEVGKLADLVVLSVDPTRSIAATRTIEMVIAAGRVAARHR